MGRLTLVFGISRTKVTIRLAPAGTRKDAYGSAASRARSASTRRTIVRNDLPRRFCIAASALPSRVASLRAPAAVKTTFPLPSTVRTSEKPASSKQDLSSTIFAFIGVIPRRNAA